MNIPEHFQRDFFDRTIRFVKETISKEKTFDDYLKVLTNIHIGVTGDRHILSTPNGQFMIFMTVNLLSRFCQNIDFVIPNDIKTIIRIPFVQENKLAASLQSWSQKINPLIQTRILEKPKHLYDGSIAIGYCSTQDFGETVFINSDGWFAFINTCENSLNWTSMKHNPIGAFSASCLGVSELFKIVMGRLQHPYKNIGSFTFSTFDYGFSKAPLLNPELPANISLGDLTLVSLGALNSSLLMTLSYIPGIQSTSLTTIEHDNLDITNLNRYPFSFAEDCIIGISKIKSAAKFIESISKLKIKVPLKKKI